jgi:hypothetical protein
MTKEQEQSTSPAVIAVRAKKGLALATGNPLDKIELNPKEVEKNGVQSEETLIERVVSLMQRRKRALQMKRSKPRITRARNIKKTRLATQDQLMRRAMRMAKTMLRKRAAGARGANYNNLSPAQKMNIDRQIEPRTKNIKAIATRLMPRVKAGEMKRLNAVRTHKSTKGVYGNVQNLTQGYQPVIYSKLLGEKVSSEDLNAMFSMYEGKILSAVTAPIRLAAKTVAAGGLVAHALSKPENLAFDVGTLAAYGIKKLSGLGKVDPDKKKKDKSDKYSDKMNQQSLIQSKERTKQALLKTKQMQQKPATPSSPKPSSVSSTPAPKQQTQSAPKQQSTPAAQQQTANSYTSPSNFAQRLSQIKKNIKTPTAPSAQATSSFRQQKQAAAAKSTQQPVATPQPAAEPVSQPATQSSIIIPEPSRVRTQQMQKNLEPAPKTLSQIRQQRQSAAAKVARQQMGLVNHVELEDGTPLSESFIVDRASGYSGVYTAKDLGITMQGGFALHPSVEEEIGAGFEGTDKLTNKYKKDTPGEAVEAFARMMRAKRKANTPC